MILSWKGGSVLERECTTVEEEGVKGRRIGEGISTKKMIQISPKIGIRNREERQFTCPGERF